MQGSLKPSVRFSIIRNSACWFFFVIFCVDLVLEYQQFSPCCHFPGPSCWFQRIAAQTGKTDRCLGLKNMIVKMMTHAGEQIALSLKMNLNLHEIVLKSQSCICTTIHDAFNANSIFLVLFERPTHEEMMVLVFFRSFLFPWNLGYFLQAGHLLRFRSLVLIYIVRPFTGIVWNQSISSLLPRITFTETLQYLQWWSSEDRQCSWSEDLQW